MQKTSKQLNLDQPSCEQKKWRVGWLTGAKALGESWRVSRHMKEQGALLSQENVAKLDEAGGNGAAREGCFDNTKAMAWGHWSHVEGSGGLERCGSRTAESHTKGISSQPLGFQPRRQIN